MVIKIICTNIYNLNTFYICKNVPVFVRLAEVQWQLRFFFVIIFYSSHTSSSSISLWCSVSMTWDAFLGNSTSH